MNKWLNKCLKIWPFHRQKTWLLLAIALLAILLGYIPLRLAITQVRVSQPQAIFVLGGHYRRMTFAAEFWQSHRDLEIWLSGVIPNPSLERVFAKANIPDRVIHYEQCATDTVTNFTCNVDRFARDRMWRVYLITSDYHMRRSRAIATFIFGSRGIIATPIVVSHQSPKPRESIWKVLRDCVRSILWLFTGRSGASLNPDL